MKATKTRIAKRSIRIDGETYEIDHVRDLGDGVHEVSCGRMEFVIAPDSETAGQAARARWAEMAENDPEEFRCMVGDEVLVNWALGQNAGPGSVGCDSLEEWLDLHLSHPEEEFASYDGMECTVDACGAEIVEEVGYKPTVAYRHN